MTESVRHRIVVRGVVQGVGFRPYVHRLASELDIDGFVRNETSHVHIEVEGPASRVNRFERRLQREIPPMAVIHGVDVEEVPCLARPGFEIAASVAKRPGRSAVVIPPDTATCGDCLDEMSDPGDRRYRYPFINCTNCGPRFTIITSLPYDRPNTTMQQFDLCSACASQYGDPNDRRHHAQPLACESCGPRLWHEREGRITNGSDEAVAEVHDDLDRGQVVAIKGIGGFHLVVNAESDGAIRRLRKRKSRVDKPFAVMVPDLEAVRRIAHIDPSEAAVLRSPARPIILLRARDESPLSSLVAPGNPLVGLMLPYSPIHHLLFQPIPGHRSAVPEALVMTSGNISGEPICFDDADARRRLGHLADSFCFHDRTIHAPCDDSVVRVLNGVEFPIRRSRGYAPLPVQLPISVAPILAVGGDIKNTFALGSGETAWISQHLGDMENFETLRAFESSVEFFTSVLDLPPDIVATDAHPAYRSRRWARRPGRRMPTVEVQHHHAHLASLMAEHGLDGSEPVIGFVFDGTGYGLDGTLWGGELLVGDYAGFQRCGHLAGVLLPGGDAAALNPCRAALAHLFAADISWSDLPPTLACDATELRVLRQQLTSPASCITSSSMGRLFDAVSSLLGLRHRITYEAQAAIDLEILADRGCASAAPELRFTVDSAGVFDPAPVLRGLVEGIRSGIDTAVLARGFHEAVVGMIVESAECVRRDRSLDVVGLTGGVFQNVLLARLTISRLQSAGFRVLTHHLVPANDGGLALGQIMVAAHQRGPLPVPQGAGN